MMLGQRLSAIIQQKKISQSELARLIGVHRVSISQLISGKNQPKVETLEKIAIALGVSVADLVGEDPAIPRGYIKIPVIGSVPAGVPLEAIEVYDGEVLIPARIARGKTVFAIRVKGQSMHDRIQEGDVVIVAKDVPFTNGDVVVIRVNADNEVTCKIFHREGDVIVLQPANPKFKTIVLSPENDQHVKVLGKVITLIREKP